MRTKALFLSVCVVFASVAASAFAQTTDLPTSKLLIEDVPGHAQKMNSLPMTMAVSPDGRYIVTINAGYGTWESQYHQSLAVVDTKTGTITDFPDARTGDGSAKQTLYSGLAFSHDGKHLYAAAGILAGPLSTEAVNKKEDEGGVLVYSFTDGKIVPARILPIPLQKLATGKTTRLPEGNETDRALPFPAAIVVTGTPQSEKLLVADNLSDDVLLMNATTGAIEHRFDLSESNAVPSTYPIALALAQDKQHAFVALWNSSEIVELNLATNTIGRRLTLLKPSNPVTPGSHPTSLTLSSNGKTLYVALANRDTVAALNVSAGQLSVRGYYDTRLPGQSHFGAVPVAVAENIAQNRLYVANMESDSIAVFNTRKLTTKISHSGMVEPDGFIPTEWLPISMTYTGGKLYIATGKGKGTGPNNFPQKPATDSNPTSKSKRTDTYIATLLYGSLATMNTAEIEKNLPQWTQTVLESNRMKAAAETIPFASAQQNPIKHIIYIIKENRTYDQVFGDLQQNGKPVGNGDSSLTMYGESITPNQHKLALQFGVLDNFLDSGEVSGEGHVWSTAAIASDYLEKTWQQAYRGWQRSYDYEGVVADGYPLLQKIPDVNEPSSGYLWGNLAAHGKTYYHFGEYIASTFCDEETVSDPKLGPMLAGPKCAHKKIAPGEPLPAEWGGGTNKWPWGIPILAANTATKPELVGHFAPEAPDFNLRVPDQIRADIFLRHLNEWIADMKQGKDTMPNFILIRLGNDHTAGTTPGGPTPKSSVADNDLAVGRAVEAISHSPFWDSTAFFILEDDAQNGADHVDAHRSTALVISKYSPRGANNTPFVDSRFYSTVSVIRTMETLLGLPPMNNNDAFSSLISSLFTGPGDQSPFTADTSNRDNGLIYTANAKTAAGAKESLRMDFRHADHADAQKLNVILWKDAMGAKPIPAMLFERHKKATKDDDDD